MADSLKGVAAKSSPVLQRAAAASGAAKQAPQPPSDQISRRLSSSSSPSDLENDDSSEWSGDESRGVFVSYNAFESEALDCVEKWKFALDRAPDASLPQRAAVEAQLKDADLLLRRFHATVNAATFDQDATSQSSSELRQQLLVKLQQLEASGIAHFQQQLKARTFQNVFELEAFFKDTRPLSVDVSSSGPSNSSSSSSSPKTAPKAEKDTKEKPSLASAKRTPSKGSVTLPSATSTGGSGAGTAATAPVQSVGATRPPVNRSAGVANGAGDRLREQVNRRAKRKQSVLDRSRGALTMRKARYHIVADVTEVHLWLGQEAVLTVSLYSLTEDRVVSEEVTMPLPPAAGALPPGKFRVTFLDVPIAAVEDLHLVCRVVRIGKLKYDYAKAQQLAATATNMLGTTALTAVATVAVGVSPTMATATAGTSTGGSGGSPSSPALAPAASSAAGISSSDVRRPFALAAVALSDAVEVEDSTPTKTAMHLFAPAVEADFSHAHTYIINEDREHPLTLVKAKGLVMTLRQVSGPYPGLDAANPNVKKYGLGHLSRPLELRDGDTRHDLYLTLEEAQLSSDAIRGGKEPSLEIIVEPCSADGRLLPGCAPYKSGVYYHNATPAWNETVRFDLLKWKDLQCVNLVARHVAENGKFIDVGTAQLRVQQPDGSLVPNGSKQLNLTAKGATLSVSTQIVSSKYSSNVPLMSLLNWKTSSASISEVLIKCTLLDKAELIKFHKEIFEALLEIMELLPDVAALAFTTMVTILGLAAESGQSSDEHDVDPLHRCFDTFISKTFANARAHFVLIDRLVALGGGAGSAPSSGKGTSRRKAAAAASGTNSSKTSQRALAMALKALPYTLRLIIKSRQEHHLQRKKVAGDGNTKSVASVFNQASESASPVGLAAVPVSLQNDEELKTEMGKALAALFSIAQLVGIQTKLVRILPETLSVLEIIYTTAEQRSILVSLLEALSTDTSSLGVEKLLLMEHYMNTPLLPVSVFLRHVKMQLRKSKEEKLHCVRLLGDLLRVLIVAPATSPVHAELIALHVQMPPPADAAVASSPRGSSSPAIAPAAAPAGGSGGVAASPSGRIKIKNKDALDALAKPDSDPKDSSSSSKDKDKEKDKDKDKDKEKEKEKEKKKSTRKEDKDGKEKTATGAASSSKSSTKRSTAESSTEDSSESSSADYEAGLREKLLTGKQHKRDRSAVDVDSLPHRAHMQPPRKHAPLALWAQLLDVLPALTRVLCGDMSATALGASGDDEDPAAASGRSGGLSLSASAVIDLTSRLELMTVVTAILQLVSTAQMRLYFAYAKEHDTHTKLIKALVEGCLEMVGRIGAEQFNVPLTWSELVLVQLRVIVRVIGWLEQPILQLQHEDEEEEPEEPPTPKKKKTQTSAAPAAAAASQPGAGVGGATASQGVRVLSDEQLRLWSRYQRLIAATIQHGALQLELYAFRAPTIAPRVLGRRATATTDVRLVLLRRLVRLWRQFEPYQLSVVSDLTVYVLAMCVSGEKSGAVRRVGLALYWSLLTRDAALSDDAAFASVEVRTIQALEELSRWAHWDEAALRKFFEVELKQQQLKLHVSKTEAAVTAQVTGKPHLAVRPARQKASNAALSSRLTGFVSDVLSLLHLLTELRGLPSGAEYEEERAFAVTQLMSYLRQTQHGEAYVKYAHKLSRMYEEAEQFVEAGFAVMQHANSLDWSTKSLQPVLHYPAQTSRERKLALLQQSLTLFERGRAYEQAIAVLQQIITADREQLYNYYQLATNLRLQAQFYEKIMEEERFFSNYFFVYYFGSGFPKALRKKAFVYRGLELERIPNFIQRMSKKFPQAEIVKSTEPITDHDRPGQFLQIFTVLPSSEEEMLGRERPVNPDIPERVQKYLQANEVSVFHYSRPFKKDTGKPKDDNEFANLWIAKTFCVVSETFPNVQRRLEVVERRELIISPIENAVNAVAAKNSELRELFSKFAQADVSMKIDRLSMALNGVLDAAVNGGTAKYQSAFLTGEFKKSNPDKKKFVERLEAHLVDQVQLLGRGLSLHSELVPDALLGLHSHLENVYFKLAEQTKIDARAWYKPVPRQKPGVAGGVGSATSGGGGIIGSIVKSTSRPNIGQAPPDQ